MLDCRGLVLDDGERWEEVFEAVAPGEDFRLSFRLYRGSSLDVGKLAEVEPYREVHLVFRVEDACLVL